MLRRMHWLWAIALLAVPGAGLAQSPSVVVPDTRPDTAPPPPRERQPLVQQAPPEPSGAPQIAPFTLTSVVVEGSTLPPTELEAAWRPFVGQTMDGTQLARLTDAIVAAYSESEVAIYTVVVPAQDFTGGVLRVRALEGWIESATLNGGEGSRARDLVEAYVRKLRAERPLSKRSLQRYVSLIRDIPGLRSDIRLVTGGQPEAVALQIDLDPDQLQVGLAANNRGAAFLGRTQIAADLYLNSLLRGGDQTRFTVAFPTDTERFQYYAASHTTPLNTEGTTVQLNAGHLRTRPAGTAIRGRASSVGLQLTHPLIRSYDQDLYLTIGLDGLNAENAFLGATFTDDRTRALRAALAYTWQSDRRLAYLAGSLSHGLDAFGARASSPAFTELEFTKANGRARFTSYMGDQLLLRLAAAGQWSNDRLPASELFALGGDEFGRAYEAAIIAGDYGWGASAEVAWRPLAQPVGFSGSEAYAFVDGGKVWFRSRLGLPTADARLSSAGVGARTTWRGRIFVELELAKGLTNPSPLLDRDEWRGLFAIRTLW